MVKDKGKKNPLILQDYFLWERVCRTAVPLYDRFNRLMRENVENTKLQAIQVLSSSQESPQKQKTTVVKGQEKGIMKAEKMRCFDRTVHRKIAKGLYRIEARIDLHGLIQDEAYRCLKEFLQSSHQRGLRYVLVITGKGRSHGSDGVLCQFVPYWLSTPIFQCYVHAFEQAVHRHGGSGALYIQLRRFL
ncbi:conserved protein of unknown function [Bartonella clarridgeiae 73]|uniref:Smr domain-containing protein n=1 Tax=Bartonella clarridgeiae (strain CCUG 45776 / CIP 104772 / 73) TaxID=696125 RepID=E6YG10_BARC7|nr:Smr/MutS family protein [Bartonella clarridgeiae]WCR55593.1 MAG: Smr protein/MutS2 [Bartonella clarridgeiae]CBI75798.1 conserved protein of unknown function [Bartonella clarridgeiae 73]